jgi:pilus assembly protein CpaB
MRKTGRNLVLYALVLGLLAAGGAAWYVSTAEAAANPSESVVVAKTRIPARAFITEDMLTLKKMPKGAVHPESSATMAPYIGKTTKQSIAASEQVLASKIFKNREQTGLAFVLPEGRRAVAINVSEAIAAGGLILPGDKIDIIGYCIVTPPLTSVERTTTTARSQVARGFYSLQAIEVLAVAQEVEGEEAAEPLQTVQSRNAESMMAGQRRPSTKPAAKTFTLSLTPDEAQRLVLLENHPDCKLRLALRAAVDNAPIRTLVADFDPAVSLEPVLAPGR